MPMSTGCEVYVTANILAHNRDLPGVEEYFERTKGDWSRTR